MPAISVIVPVYKTQQYLHQCIDSILAQSHTDFELILVDDGSPDNCGAICEKYAAQDDRVRVIHQENQGQAAARNHGIAIAEAEWICFVDSDDVVHPQMLEILYHSVMATKANISMCSAIEDTSCPEFFHNHQQPAYTSIVMNESELLQLYNHVRYKPWIVWGKLIRRQIVESIPFAEGKIYEDNAIVCRWLVEAKTVADIGAKLYFYRVNPTGATKCEFQLKHLDYLWALEQMTLFFESCNYHQLVSKFGKTFLTTSAQYYNRVTQELCSKRAARNICRKMREIYHPRKDLLALSKEEKSLIFRAMYPYTKFHWILKGRLNKFVQQFWYALNRRRRNDS